MPTPNILIILADDLGVDTFRIDQGNKQVVAQVSGGTDSAGPVRLPTFERLLTSGIHFEQAWAHPVCTPTRASLWTGLQAWKTTLGYPNPLNESLPDLAVTGTPIQSLAQVLKAKANYRCAMFGKWDLGIAKNPVTWGWDYFAGIFRGGLRPVGVQEYGFPPPPSRLGYDRLLQATNSSKAPLCQSVAALLASKYDETFLRQNPDLRFYIWHKDIVQSDGTVTSRQPPSARKHLYATEDQVADAKQWITEQKGLGPWCVALNLITPHDPFHVPPPGTFSPDIFTDPAKPSVQEMLVAMMQSMDYYIGDLLQAIDDQLDNTVIIVVGDNGTQDVDRDTGENIDGVVGDDKGTDSVGGVHVPMLISDGRRMKGLSPCYTTTAPRSVSDPVHVMDIYRTVLDIAGVGATVTSDSISMAPHLTGVGSKRTINFSQLYVGTQPDVDGFTHFSPGTGASVSDGTYKLTCRALLGGSGQNTYLVDEQGTKVGKPVFTYDFYRLDADPAIPGSRIEVRQPSFQRKGAGFAVIDPDHCARILSLYSALNRERLDSNQTRFPYIGDAAPLLSINSLTLSSGQSITAPAMELHAKDFTIAARIKLSSTSNRNIVFGNFGSVGNSWQMLFTIQAGGAPFANLRTDMPTNGSDPDQDLLALTGATTLTPGVFRHVAYTFTWGADRISPCCVIYVDGIEVGRVSRTITPNPKIRNLYQLMPSSNPYLIGRKQDTNDNGSWFAGEMQNFRVYGRALDPIEINAIK